jgi:CMP-N,N'-diacetyllegionaminic acid synthase
MKDTNDDFSGSTLVIIPARHNSIGLPGKNTRLFRNKPLYRHTLDLALKLFPSQSVVVTSDDEEILRSCEELCQVIQRPSELAMHETPMKLVIRHTLETFPGYQWGLLLQPTTPFRQERDVLLSWELLLSAKDTEGVFSVMRSRQIPGYSMFQADASGSLIMGEQNIFGRQEAPVWWALNGSLYWFDIPAFLRKGSLSALSPVLAYEMSIRESLDIDTEEDWKIAECWGRLSYDSL